MNNLIEKEINYWWVSLIIGILMILFGIWCIATPWTTVIALSYMFAFMFLITGLSEFVSLSFQSANWGWNLASGVFDVFVGILILSLPLPQLTLLLAYLVGFWMMFRSVTAMGMSIYLQKQGFAGWGWLLALAIIGLLLSFIFLMSPIIANSFIVMLFSFSMISYGVFRLSLAFQLKRLK